MSKSFVKSTVLLYALLPQLNFCVHFPKYWRQHLIISCKSFILFQLVVPATSFLKALSYQRGPTPLGDDSSNAHYKTIDQSLAFEAEEALVKPSWSWVLIDTNLSSLALEVQLHTDINKQEFKRRRKAFKEQRQEAKIQWINPRAPSPPHNIALPLTAFLLHSKTADTSFARHVQ